jgi:glycosyltransferase involved in cell wall biosynthesis
MVEEDKGLTIAIASAMFFPGLGGAQVMLHNLAISLEARGHKVIVLPSFSQVAKLWRRGSHNNLPYKLVPLPPKQHGGLQLRGYMRMQRAYFGYLQRRYEFDVWQAFGTYPAGAAVADFTSRHDIPSVVRTCGSDIQMNRSLEYGIRLDPDIDQLIKRYATKCDRMIALTDSVVSDCVDIGMERENVEVIGCAVDLDRFDETTVDADQVRSRHDIPADSFLFVTVGRNHPKKGFETLVDAVPKLRNRLPTGGPDVHVAFVGRDMGPLKRKTRELGVDDAISFVGEIEPTVDEGSYQLPPKGVIEMYKASDTVVFPSLLETFGNVNIEAMASGTPIVGTDAPGCRDIIDHDYNGLKATAGNPESLAEEMYRVYSSPGLREHLVAGARDTITNHYTWDVITDRYETLYMSLHSSKSGDRSN